MQRLAALSSGTLSTLMHEKGMQDCDKYTAIDAFHQRVLFVAQALVPVPDETWMQLFERAYLIAYAPPEALDHADPVPACMPEAYPYTPSAKETVQGAEPSHNAPELENQAQNPSSYMPNECTLPKTFARAQQITMQNLLNTS